ncbi:MAG: hypothetical protein KKA05_09895 [Alphaproteobacteria bacterium]|nr:hypothetical protein [Alphaproteobacteria bacterium]
MTEDKKADWQKTANVNQNEKRRGSPTFAAVRFKSQADKDWLDSVVKMFNGTKEESLIAAYRLLEKELDKKAK